MTPEFTGKLGGEGGYWLLRGQGAAPAALLVAAAGFLGCASDSTAPPAVGPPTQVGYSAQPSDAAAGAPMGAVRVQIRDANGNLVTSAADQVMLAMGTNPGGATLSGTLGVTAVNGEAVFDNVSIDQTGTGYTLVASAPSLTSSTSGPFDIVQPTITISPANLDSLVGAGATIPYDALATDPTNNQSFITSFAWMSDTPAVATIDPAMGVLTVVGNGTTTLTATTSSGASATTTFRSATLAATQILSFAFTIPIRVINVTWDGNFYYLSNGGSAGSGQIQQVDATGAVQQTTAINMDMRGMFYRPADGLFYAKNFGTDWFTVDPSTGNFTQVLTGIFNQIQTKPDISADGSTIYEHDNGTVRMLDFTTGAETGTITGLQFGSFPGQHVVQTDGDHLLTMDENGTIYTYDLQGRLVTSFVLPVGVVAQSIWSLSFANGMLWVSDTGGGMGTLFAYQLTQQ